MMRSYLTMLCATALLAGCGGGGGAGGGGMVDFRTSAPSSTLDFPYLPWTKPYTTSCGTDCTSTTSYTAYAGNLSVTNLPMLRASDLPFAPIGHNEDGHKRLLVGVDHVNRPLADLPIVGSRNGLNLHYGTLDDGIDRQTLTDYFASGYRGEPVERFANRPEVRLIGPHTARDVSLVTHTLQLLNTTLPEDFTITSLETMPTRSLRHTVDAEGYYLASGEERDNTIYIEVVPIGAFYTRDAGATTWTNTDGHTMTSAYIQMNEEAPAYHDDRQAMILLAHEMLHTLGLNHVGYIFDSIMLDGNAIYYPRQGDLYQPMSLLYPQDRAALTALYRDLTPGEDYRNLGSWSATATHLHGNGPHTGFGVILQNGFAEPWAYGPMPAEDLADNSALSGTVTWNGGLLGFSDQERPVAGDATLRVTLATLAGSAAFTNLETWAGAPGSFAPGSGTTWGDGDLRYSIAVRGNTFQQTGGDTGVVTGIFTGPFHEGAAGTLKRSDLTAAFGATR